MVEKYQQVGILRRLCQSRRGLVSRYSVFHQVKPFRRGHIIAQTGLITLIMIVTCGLQWGFGTGSAQPLSILAHTVQAGPPPQWEPVDSTNPRLDGDDKSVLSPPVSLAGFQQQETIKESVTVRHAGVFDDSFNETDPLDQVILLTSAVMESQATVVPPLFEMDDVGFAWRAFQAPSKRKQFGASQTTAISIPPLPLDDVPPQEPERQTEWDLVPPPIEPSPEKSAPLISLPPEEVFPELAPVASNDQGTVSVTLEVTPEGIPIFTEESLATAEILAGFADVEPTLTSTQNFTALVEPTPAPGTLPPAPMAQDATEETAEAKLLPPPDNPLFHTRFDQLNRPMAGIHVGFPAETGTQPLNVAAQQSTETPPLLIWGGDGWFEPRPNRYPVPFAYQPLYYEEVNLERCGTGHGFLQPLFSSAAFAKNTVILPYSLVVSPPRSQVPTPGDCPSGHRIPLFH